MTSTIPDTITVYSTVWCPDCKRAKRFFGEQRVPYVNIDIEQDAGAMAFVEKVNNGMRSIPTIVFPDGSIQTTAVSGGGVPVWTSAASTHNHLGQAWSGAFSPGLSVTTTTSAVSTSLPISTAPRRS